MGKIISFINQKGGVGKTTLAFNCAHALRAKGHRVLCLDLDPQANLSMLFQGNNDSNLHHLLINSIKELRPLHTALMLSEVLQSKSGVDFLPGGQELSGFELTVAGISGARQLILKKFIETNGLSRRYDYIVIDCPPTLGLLVINALCASDGVIIPFRPDDFSHRGLEHFYQVLDDIGDMGIVKTPEVILHVPNLVDLRRKQESEDLTKIMEFIDNRLGPSKVADAFLNKAGLVKSQATKTSVYEMKGQEYSELRDKFLAMATKIEEWANV